MTATAPHSAPRRAPLWRRVRHCVHRRVLVTGVALALAAVVVGGGIWLRQAVTPHALDTIDSTHKSVTWCSALKTNQVFVFGVWFGNPSTATATLRSISFPNGLPRHVHFYRTVVTPQKFLTGCGWPPGIDDLAQLGGHPVAPLYAVDGYRLGPGQYMTLIVGMSADAPGTYIVGPVTVHAEVRAFFGTVPIESTYTQYGALCPGVSSDVCHAAIDKAAQ